MVRQAPSRRERLKRQTARRATAGPLAGFWRRLFRRGRRRRAVAALSWPCDTSRQGSDHASPAPAIRVRPRRIPWIKAPPVLTQSPLQPIVVRRFPARLPEGHGCPALFRAGKGSPGDRPESPSTSRQPPDRPHTPRRKRRLPPAPRDLTASAGKAGTDGERCRFGRVMRQGCANAAGSDGRSNRRV